LSLVLRVREHGRLPVGHEGLTEAELEYLVRLRDRGLTFFTEERAQGRWYCRLAGFAGAIAMPGGRTLEVLPKIGSLSVPDTRGLLMRMLSAADVAPSLDEVAADYANSPNLIEAYLRFAAELALQQVRMGLVHAYRRMDQRIPVVRGRLLVARQLARLPERFDAHLVRTDDFLSDTPVNRIIKAGIQWIGRNTRLTSTAAKCREAVMRMDAVADFVGSQRALADATRSQGVRAVLDRRHTRLAPLLKVLGLLTDGLGAAPEAGVEAPGPTLMFDMSKVFEALLATRLRRVLPDCDVDEQASYRFDLDGRFMLRPDLVVRRRGQPMLVLDAKWKRIGSSDDVAAGDLRQAFAYARILGLKNAALVFPKVDAYVPAVHDVRVADGSEVRIHLSHVAVMTTDWAELDDDLGRLSSRAGMGPSSAPKGDLFDSPRP
jgi:5-methylcytosine-specific restriction enzyme subunit McrC